MRKSAFRVLLSLTLLSFVTSFASADLVGYWNFDDESADDQSGNDNDGILNGPDFSEDTPTGNGLSLDTTVGGTVQVAHSDSLAMGDTLSVAYWMRAENLDQSGDWNGPMGKISDPREGGGWEMQRFGDQSRIDIRLDTDEQANVVVGNLVGTFDDEWVHVAWTVDEGFWQSFFNGELVQSGEYLHGSGFANESDLFFGNRGNCCAYVGLLDDIAIFDHVLSDDEVISLAEGNPPVNNPVGLAGDFDSDNDLDADDVNALISEINGGMSLDFDVSKDGAVDRADLNTWVKDLRKTWFGDSNLDGEFGSTDLVTVFQAGKFETNQPATWDQGDWNGDGIFSSSDLVSAFQDGGFEQGPVAANSVPEPSSLVLLLFGAMAIVRRNRR